MKYDNHSDKKIARRAGLLYLLLAIPAAYSLLFVLSKIVVQNNAAATVHHLLLQEALFRTGIVSQLLSTILFIFLVLQLYRLLKKVNPHQARLMVILVVVQVPLAFILETFSIASLMIAKGEVLKTLSAAEREDMAFLFLKLHTYGIITLQLFWGLWLIPFGQLVYRSGFIPKLSGILLFINGTAYIAASLTALLLPVYYPLIRPYAFVLYSTGEPVIILWLLIKGVKETRPVADFNH